MINQDSKQFLSYLLGTLKTFKGITRKSVLHNFFTILGENSFDDAGLLKIKDSLIVVSTDGIVEELVNDDPWLAGFYSVVVNVNDVVAKGARPFGYACVISSSSVEVLKEIVRGIRYGLDKYQIKFLKGHTHPDTTFNAVDATVVGVAEATFLASTTAKPNDKIVLAIDLDGKFGTMGWVKIFDSVLSKLSQEILERIDAVNEVARRKLATASRDVSGPGILGTIAMLCESSRVGAFIDLESIPKPKGIELKDWLTSYPALGFIFTTNKAKECTTLLQRHGFSAKVIGTVLKESKIFITSNGLTETFMDLDKCSIFGKMPETEGK